MREAAESGFILLESIIAISLITIIMGAVGAEYVTGLVASNSSRLRATASEIAGSQMDQLQALQPSDLTTGRGSSAVDAERTILAKFPTSVSGTNLEAYAVNGANSSSVTVGTDPVPTTVGNLTFSVYRYFECTATPVTAGSCVTPPSQSTPAYNNLRALVVVTWPQRGCPSVTVGNTTGPTCSFTSTAIINNDNDLTFDLNQPLPPAPVVNPTSSLTVAGNDVISYQMTTTANAGGVAPLTWSVTSGSLPAGLSMSTGGLITGKVSTTSNSNTTVTSTFTVTDAFNRTASQAVTWTVEPNLSVTPIAGQASLVGTAISTVTVQATGGGGAGFTWSDPNSTLPPGLSISSSGAITGTPTTPAPKTYAVSLTVTDPQSCSACANPPRTAVGTFNWSINYPPLVVTAPANQTATVNTTLSAAKQVAMSAAGGDGNYSWSVSGQPTGLNINSSTGVISGTPTVTGTYSVTVTVTDASAGVTPSMVTFKWAVVAMPSFTSPPGAQTNAVGGTVALGTSPICPDAPCTYTVSGAPTNLAIDGSGVIRGTVGGAAKIYSGVTVTATDSAGATTTTPGFTWTITSAPTIGSLGTQSFTETDSESVPLAYSCPTGSCTIGLSASVPGLGLATAASTANNTTQTSLTVSGTGTVYVTGTVQNSAVTGTATSAPYQPVATITTADSAKATTSPVTWTAYTVSTLTSPGNLTSNSYAVVKVPIASSCPNAPCTYGLTGAPAGLSISSATGVISGTITSAAKTFSGVTVTSVDADGVSASPVSFSWTVIAARNNLASLFNNVGVTQNSSTASGNFDGVGDSFSATTLASAGVTAGGTFVSNGLSFAWPTSSGTGQPDNALASGQTVTISGSGSKLGFLLSSAYGSASGTATITYTDGTTQNFTLSSPDWWGSSSSAGVAANNAYYNGSNNNQNTQSVNIYYSGVALTAGKTVASVKLPNISSAVGTNVNSMHIFAVSLTSATLTASNNNVGVTADNARTNGNLDGSGNSLSKTALSNAGATSGGTVTTSGIPFTWPSAAGTGSADNTVASGQIFSYGGSGGTLGFLVTSVNAATSGTATIYYTDGTLQTFTLSAPLITSTSSPVISTSYVNTQNASNVSYTANIFLSSVALAAGKTIDSIQLPSISTNANSGTNAMHVFSVGAK